jgi:predicted MPP superfamily phosphohydrolase
MPGSSRALPDVGRRRVLRVLASAGIGVVTGSAVHGAVYERHRVGVTRATLAVSALPRPLEGLRVALITDLHLSQMVPREDISQAVALAASERPDLIVLGGDYVTFADRHFIEPCAELLAPLTAPHGVFAVLGNHDDEPEMSRALSRNGVAVLADDRTTLTVRNERIELVGLRFWSKKTSRAASIRPCRSTSRCCSRDTPTAARSCSPASDRLRRASSR